MIIFNVYYSNALFFQKLVPYLVLFNTFFCKVIIAVQFNGQIFTRTIKINNVFPNAKLPSEFSPF